MSSTPSSPWSSRGSLLFFIGLVVLQGVLVQPAGAALGAWGGEGPWVNRVEAVAVDPFDSDHLLVGTERGILQSRDGGNTWEDSHLGNFSATALVFDPNRAGVVYAAHRQGFYKSLDNGFGWSLLPMPATVAELEIDPGNSDRLYALLTYIGDEDPRMLTSDDGGASWTPAGPASDDRSFRQLAIDPTDPSILVLSSFDRVWKSLDRGETWSEITPPPGSIEDYRALALDPSDPRILYTGGHETIYRTNDGGELWQPTSPGPLRVEALQALAGGRLFALGPNGIQRSLDRGQSWQRIRIDGGSQNALALAADPSRPGRLYAGTGGDGLLVSEDWGSSWSVLDLPNRVAAAVEAMAVAPSLPPVLYAGTETGGIFRSSDGGQSWQRSSRGLWVDRVHTLVVDPEDARTIWAGTPFGVFTSGDAGASWSHRPFDDLGADFSAQRTYTLSIDRRDSRRVVAGSDAGIHRTLDGGQTWERVLDLAGEPFENIFDLNHDPHDPDHIVALSRFTLYHSLDGGATWSVLNTMDFTFKLWDWLFDPLRPGVAWVSAFGGNFDFDATGVFVTRDGGATFTLSTDGLCGMTSCNSLLEMDWVGPDHLVGQARGPVYESRDNGSSWQLLPFGYEGFVNSLAVHPWSPSTVYMGTSKGTWNFVDPGCDAATTLCLQDERFQLEMSWRDFENRTGRARFVPLDSDDSAVGWFFDPDNWEVLAKVIDGTGTDGHFWVFAGVASNVETVLRFTDTRTGRVRHYHSPLGQTPGTLAEIGVFDSDAPVEDPPVLDEEFASLGATPPQNRQRGFDPSAMGQGCTPSATRACLGDGRYRLEVSWLDFAGQSGDANLVPQGSSDSALWWFFSESNWELLVKVIDGCGTNNRHWIFASSTTNVAYELTVTDTTTGEIVNYTSTLGQGAPTLTDTEALSGCG